MRRRTGARTRSSRSASSTARTASGRCTGSRPLRAAAPPRSSGPRAAPPEGSQDGRTPAAHSRMTAAVWRDPLRHAAGLEGWSVGSTAWVVGGAHTESGRPILVADAHLPPTVPALLYLAHVRGGDLDLAGAMVP